MQLPFETIRRPAALAAGFALLAACGGDLTLPDDGGGVTPGPDAITVQGGDGQDGTVGEMLAEPLTVRVTSDGQPIAGQGVVFEAAEGDGTFAPDTTVTNGSGIATARWTLGSTPGGHAATAKLITGGQLVHFSAAAAVGPPASLTMVSGDEQVGEAFAPLADPLVVEVTDRFGNPVDDVTVHWAVMAGRGELSAEAVESNSDGRAQVTWTLGFFLGTQRVDATVEGVDGSPVTFRAGIF
jgi:hypothetical protein